MYNVGMSAADSTAFSLAAGGPMLPAALSASGMSEAAVHGITNALNLSSFSMSAGNQVYREALEQGDDTQTALVKGAMDGAIEAATELIGGENMIKIATGKMKPGLIRAMATQFGSEGVEETLGDVLNLVGQQAALGKKSDISKAVASYQAQGLSKGEAQKRALKDWAIETAEDTLAGGLSGLGMGAAASASAGAYGTIDTARSLKNADAGTYQNIAHGLTTDTDAYHTEGGVKAAERAKTLAENIAQKTKEGGNASLLDRVRLAGNMELMNQEESSYYEEHPDEYAKDAEEYKNHLNQSLRVSLENRETPEKYQTKETDYSSSQGYADMLKVANGNMSTEEKAASLGEIYNRMKNSTSSAARNDAEDFYSMLSAKAGVSAKSSVLAKQTLQDAYLAGKSGEDFEAGSMRQQEAYNSGRIEFLKSSGSQTAADAEEVKNAGVRVGNISGTAKEFEIRNGQTYVKLDNGSSVPARMAEYKTDTEAYVWNHAADQGTLKAKNAYVENFTADVPVGRYDNAFRKYYTAGALDESMQRTENTSFDQVYENDSAAYKALIPRETLRNIYNAGSQETEDQYVKYMQESGNTVARRGTGKVYVMEGETTSDVTDEKSFTNKAGETLDYLPLVQALAKATNTDIILSSNESKKVNGYYDRAMQRIVLNTNNKEDLYHTMIHEGVGEVMQAFNMKGALKVRSALLEYTAEKYQGDELTKHVEAYQDAYTAVEKTKSVEAAMGEMMNDAMSGIFSSKEGIHDFSEWLEKKQGAKQQKSVLGTLADHFKGIKSSMRNLLNRGTLTSSGQHAAMIAEKNASKIRKMILSELDVAVANAAKAQVVEGEKEDKAFSLNVDDRKVVVDGNTFLYDKDSDAFVSSSGRVIPVADNVFTVSDMRKAENVVRDLVYEQLGALTGKDITIKEDGEIVKVSKNFKRKYTHNGFLKYAPKGDKLIKMNMASDVVEMVENSTGRRDSPDRNAKHGVSAGAGWLYYDADIAIKNENEYQIWRSIVQIQRNSQNGKDYLYDVQHPIKISSWGAASSEINPSASRAGKHALHSGRDLYENKLEISSVSNSRVASSAENSSANVSNAVQIPEGSSASLNVDDFLTDDKMVQVWGTADDNVRGSEDAVSAILSNGSKNVAGLHIAKDAAYKIAQGVIKKTGSSYGMQNLADNLTKMFEYMEGQETIDYRDLSKIMDEIAYPVVDAAEMKVGSETAEEIRKSFQGTKIRLTSQQLKEVNYIFGSLQAFRKAIPGIQVSQKEGPIQPDGQDDISTEQTSTKE